MERRPYPSGLRSPTAEAESMGRSDIPATRQTDAESDEIRNRLSRPPCPPGAKVILDRTKHGTRVCVQDFECPRLIFCGQPNTQPRSDGHGKELTPAKPRDTKPLPGLVSRTRHRLCIQAPRAQAARTTPTLRHNALREVLVDVAPNCFPRRPVRAARNRGLRRPIPRPVASTNGFNGNQTQPRAWALGAGGLIMHGATPAEPAPILTEYRRQA